jgi:hypothetical protein
LEKKHQKKEKSMKPSPLLQQRGIVVLLVLFLAACSPLIGSYSPTAYENATSLKAETLALMDKADEPFANHRVEVEQHMIELQKAYEFVRGVPSNSISAMQWEILIKRDGDLFGKFVKRWEERSTLSKVLIEEFKKLVADAFDEIICLEANKQTASECAAAQGESP